MRDEREGAHDVGQVGVLGHGRRWGELEMERGRGSLSLSGLRIEESTWEHVRIEKRKDGAGGFDTRAMVGQALPGPPISSWREMRLGAASR